MRDDKPRHVWMSPLITHGTREEPGTLTQGALVFPGSSRLGIEPKTPGWLVQDPTTRPIGDLLSGAHPGRGFFFSLGERPWSLARTGTNWHQLTR
jgi:hypothetical protein